ncbi:hypothetical protein KY284_012896 [Solanum tuberosum]|nr:hypothetical protein KY284_012896 [Solanum tuberosum]
MKESGMEGRFTVKSAWNLMRNRHEMRKDYENKDGRNATTIDYNSLVETQGITKVRAIPAIVLWTIWRRRNAIKHGNNIRYEEMVNQIVGVVRQLIKHKYPWIKRIEWSWPDIISRLGNYKPKLHYLNVTWKPPDNRRIKCNTDGASRGNSGLSSIGYCLRDSRGDLIFAKSRGVGIATNMEAESLAILEALRTCK